MSSRIDDFLTQTGHAGHAEWNQILPLLYGELRSQAATILGREDLNSTLQPTALVHEAWAKLSTDRRFESREHFLAVAAIAMRGILVDRARARAAERRGGHWKRITLTTVLSAESPSGLDLVDLDDTLEQYQSLDPRGARVVELRVFGGLTHSEIAKVLGVSLSSIESDWRLARAWLSTRLKESPSP